MPSEWNGFEATRIFRGVTYKVKVRRGSRAESPVMMVNGKTIEGLIIPFPPQGTREVDVELVL